jgi:hypothetical protein
MQLNGIAKSFRLLERALLHPKAPSRMIFIVFCISDIMANGQKKAPVKHRG